MMLSSFYLRDSDPQFYFYEGISMKVAFTAFFFLSSFLIVGSNGVNGCPPIIWNNLPAVSKHYFLSSRKTIEPSITWEIISM